MNVNESMERPPFGQKQSCGPWEMLDSLGIGGFAHVYLYQNVESSEKIAVKLCRLELTPRNKDRWIREIQIMKKLNHPNVVTAREVPEEMKRIALNDLPLLGMEYCSRGDLRKMLSKPENCCGLRESEVLSLLNDVGSGIQYLHKNKIIHRDLKPENIVLQDVGGKLVHKIIDLGYAKDLDQGSLCTSFVGTLQYLVRLFLCVKLRGRRPSQGSVFLSQAPELFENKPYTVTVDYWSFGTVLFECSCGFRPFLHNLQPVQWASKVKNKGPKDIMAVEEISGEISFSTHLPCPNNLSSALEEPLENVLQLMLTWDPVQRGGGINPEGRRPRCFELLDQLLAMKVVHVLNIATSRVHSFKLSADENLHSLQKRIEAEVQVTVTDQELLYKTGVSLDPRKPAAQCVTDTLKGWDSNAIFLFSKSLPENLGSLNSRKLPEKVQRMMHGGPTPMALAILKKVWAESVSYVCGLKEDYNLLFQGQRAAMLSLLYHNTNLTRLKTRMFADSQQLKAKLEFFKSSIQYDLEKYIDQMHYGIFSEKMLKAWQTNEEKTASFIQVAEVNHLDDKIMALHSEIVELQRSPFARRQGDVIEKLEEKAKELYRQLKITCRNPNPDPNTDSSEMVKILSQAMQNQDKILKDLYAHLGKILLSKQKIVELFPQIEKVLDDIGEAEQAVMQMQTKRQREFWQLLKIACAQNSTRNSMSVSPESVHQSVPQWTPSTQPGSGPHPLASLPGSSDSESVARLLQENQQYLSQLGSLVQTVIGDQTQSLVDQDWSWTNYESFCAKLQNV
ncbi:inhibitor of nuclear factor kappa-B kinase subunit alpha-like isoform X2 [Denticeps clupeoides]|uniref:inhibitor of nuclear factor kappa-B kinase subunit alpha-like isoform X2 n=1 Tax=Denticeps clupeoides TaxID=299321 RepID=UPI0010A34521|nr:inhibitor of nuclear factor kappa-B kinase subunit alpha-like isoform X2 [Denticeps clupeoides]XP_028822890.1 inhibitor of nuclear factor kappa-B kinase subunit alpha-like isoform X2 [Denticeps clupeoides]